MLLSFDNGIQVFEPDCTMKRSKVVFVNKSKLVLHVYCKKCGKSDPDHFEVVNRETLRLFPGQYEIIVHYQDGTVLIDSKSINTIDITEVSAPNHSKFAARKIALNLSGRSIRICFREQVSIGSILDGSVHRNL